MSAPGQKRQRSCIACKTQGDKVNLYRIVRDKDGHVSFDGTGRKAGRGAYVCSEACFQKAAKARRLDSALRVSFSKEEYAEIARDLHRAVSVGTEKVKGD